jgi:hypothetical protein
MNKQLIEAFKSLFKRAKPIYQITGPFDHAQGNKMAKDSREMFDRDFYVVVLSDHTAETITTKIIYPGIWSYLWFKAFKSYN